MNYYYCSSCNKRIELKTKKSHSKSQLYLENEGTVVNKYTIKNPELCQMNGIIIKNVILYNRRFEYYEIVSKWKLKFDNDTSIDVRSWVIYSISVLGPNLEKYVKKINHYKRQRLEFSQNIIITFKTRLDLMTYKHYIEQPMPMVERLIIRKLYKNYELINTLDDTDLTLHMGAYETGKADIHYSSNEDE